MWFRVQTWFATVGERVSRVSKLVLQWLLKLYDIYYVIQRKNLPTIKSVTNQTSMMCVTEACFFTLFLHANTFLTK